MSDNSECNCEQSRMLTLKLMFLAEVNATLTEELLKYKKDVADAAGELLLDIPAPDTVIAKLMRVNNILKKDIRDMHNEVVKLRDQVQEAQYPEHMGFLSGCGCKNCKAHKVSEEAKF